MNEENNTETTEVTQPVQETAAPSQEAATQDVGGGDQSVAAEAPAWTPSLKYKVNGVEKEFDPLFRDIVKDADTEKKIKDILERAEGTDIFRNKLSEFDVKHKDLSTKYEDQNKKLQHAANLWEKDKDQFFEFMGMDVNEIYKWVAEKLRMEDAPESEKQLYNREQESRRLAMEREQQLEFYQQKAIQEATQAKSFQLQQEMSKPEISSIASQYDSAYGQGAFETAVKQLGKQVWDTQKVDLSASEAVSQVATYFKPE